MLGRVFKQQDHSSSNASKHSYEYYNFIIEEANRRLTSTDAIIVYCKTTQEVSAYIQNNPSRVRIGFIVEKPRCLEMGEGSNTHVSPIIFERGRDANFFAQFDSALGQFYLVPLVDSNRENIFFYSTSRRQSSQVGCFEDAVILLMRFIKSSNSIANYKENSQEEKNIFRVSAKQEEKYEKLFRGTKVRYHEDSVNDQFAAKVEAKKQLESFSTVGLLALTKICRLDFLPREVLPNVERFDTMRNLRIASPLLLDEKLIHQLLLWNNKKNPALCYTELKANLAKDDKQYDFAGRSFKARHDSFVAFQRTQHNLISTLFASKFNSTPAKTEAKRIASNIADFVVGSCGMPKSR